MKIAYGYEGFQCLFNVNMDLSTNHHSVDDTDDPFIKLSDEALQWFSKAALPGGYWVDYIPWSWWRTA